MTSESLAQELSSVAQLSGEFRLRSGLTADTYFDKYQFESDPRLLQAIAQELLPLIPEDTEILAGLESARRSGAPTSNGGSHYGLRMHNFRNTNRIVRLVLCLGALMMFAAACGDDSSNTSDAPTTDAPSDSNDDPSGDDDRPADRTDDLTGDWNITAYQQAGATGLADVVADSGPTVSFGSDGVISYSTGCNSGEGEWSTFGGYTYDEDPPFLGQPLEVGALSRTDIGCSEEMADQDLAIPGALRAARQFSIDDDGILTIWNQNVMINATPA